MIVISDFILLLLSGFWRNSSVFGNRSKQNRGNDISADAPSGGEEVLPYKTQTSFIPHFGDGQFQPPTFGNRHLHNAVINDLSIIQPETCFGE
ncbi:hypothetical protein HMPREF9551_00675 [Escherichia coli MS 196-1]|nr:hypothetical protein HMPREF9551_00675 [Escherichia coli MS 196-1]